MAYENCFSALYDVFTDDVNYAERAEYICRILARNGISDGAILDVACGTGSLSEEFLRKGFEVIANDISVSMLNIARDKLSAYGDKVLILCQDMCELDLFGTVDAAVCSLDSINHLLEEDDVKKCFDSVGKFINPGGIFIFDVNTLYKHHQVLSGNTFVYEDADEAFLVWQNSECDDDNIVEMYFDIFTRVADGKYVRNSDEITERAYSVELLSDKLSASGFEVLNVYSDMTFDACKAEDERIYFVARKK